MIDERALARIGISALSRRDLLERGAAIGLGVAGATMRGGRVRAAQTPDDPAAGSFGGNLTVAIVGELPTLDEQSTSSGLTRDVTLPVYETLLAFDEDYRPQPMLARSMTPSDDGLIWTIELRQGVLFHNGEEMTSADVKASMDRWGQLSGLGKKLYAAIEGVETTDDYTVTVRLSSPLGTLPISLAHTTQNCVIYPKSVIDAGSLEPIEAGIGTGPYKLRERKPDAYIRLERFEEYAALEGGPRGYGGTKYAYVDTIDFIPVPDVAARVAGLQAGTYLMHMPEGLENDLYQVLADSPGLVTSVNQPSEWPLLYCNWQSPLMGKLAMREAVQACLDMQPIMEASFGDPQFWSLDPSLMMKQTAWWNEAGGDRYNLADPELAKQKLQDAGYDGTPIRFMSTREYAYRYAASSVAVQQMEAVGMTVDHQVIDWATVLERRAKPEEWDMFISSPGFDPDPSQISYIGGMGTYPGWWDDPETMALTQQLLQLTSFEERLPIWEQIQTNAYTQIPAIKVGNGATIRSHSTKVHGLATQFELGFIYWNVWIEG